MVYDVRSVPVIGVVARSVCSCGNFYSLTQNIAITQTVQFPDAGI
ncbi:hypothetical protein ACP4OV_016737 [Aristida adscensionis]